MRSLALIALLTAVAAAARVAPVVGQELAAGGRAAAGEVRLAVLQPELFDCPEPIHLPPIDPIEIGDRLTLAEAEAMAQSYHPALREASGRVRAAQGNWLQVGLRNNPEIGYLGEEMGDDGTAGKQGGFVRQEFITAGKRRLSRSVAAREVAAAEQRMELARLQVLTTSRINYFEVLAAERSVALANQLSDIADQSVRISELRLQALDIPRVSLLQSQIERESTALAEEQATQRLAAAWRRLGSAIGIEDLQPRPLDDSFARPLPVLSWEAMRERILAGSPELSELRYAVDRARWAIERASAGRVPNLSVEAGVTHDNVTDDTLANVQVSVPLPVFDRNQGAITQASGELAAAQAALDRKALQLEERLAAALRDYATARERTARYAEKVLPVARETLDITRKGYEAGELDFLQVLAVQQTFAEKNLSYLESLETAWKKWAEIDGLLAGRVSDETE
jgi:cobalt-zinc-cadmium efflux system outer membrane protein